MAAAVLGPLESESLTQSDENKINIFKPSVEATSECTSVTASLRASERTGWVAELAHPARDWVLTERGAVAPSRELPHQGDHSTSRSINLTLAVCGPVCRRCGQLSTGPAVTGHISIRPRQDIIQCRSIIESADSCDKSSCSMESSCRLLKRKKSTFDGRRDRTMSRRGERTRGWLLVRTRKEHCRRVPVGGPAWLPCRV